MTGFRRHLRGPQPPPPGAVEPQDARLAKALGANLQRAREELGFTVARLARSSGVPRGALVDIEEGRSPPSIDELWKLASALGLPFAALVAPRGSGVPLPFLRGDVDEPWSRRGASAPARPGRRAPAGRRGRTRARKGDR